MQWTDLSASQEATMIRAINKLRDFGVFRDYRKTNAIEDFSSRNIIYGWNYSGKTTLSRLFGAIGQGAPYKECPQATFDIRLDDGRSITESNLQTAGLKIAVFNTDFVTENLSWNGGDFNPILLLGDAVEAEKSIDHLQSRLQRCRELWQGAKTEIDRIDASLASEKTKCAREIKQTLQIVEAFTATHLASEVDRLSTDPATSILSDAQYRDDLVLALSKDKDLPPAIPSIRKQHVDSSGLLRRIEDGLAYIPGIAATLDHLRSNPTIAHWVEQGLKIHAKGQDCEFCKGHLTEERLAELRGHFSQDLSNHRSTLTNCMALVEGAAIPTKWLDALAFTAAYRDQAKGLEERLGQLSDQFNADLKSLETAIKKKMENPFSLVEMPSIEPSPAPLINRARDQAEALVRRHNEAILAFGKEKSEAIGRLKAHYAARFVLDPTSTTALEQKERNLRLQRRLKDVGDGFKSRIAGLEATVNRAQKGRERLNSQIVSLLGSDVLKIEVVSKDNRDRFTLRRSGLPAKNLSDGERTAIAFAFFLTKLEEHTSLADVIVYIDDPISSLDSNNVFRIYAAIQASLLKKCLNASGQEAFVTACRQLIISTHNFEFFDMLKKLPGRGTKYFLIKRIGTQESTLVDLPKALLKCRSEYHYLFEIIKQFHSSDDKSDITQLLLLPNALRRFLELYTYMRVPLPDSNVEARIAVLTNPQTATRITKLLHHFSHLESLDRAATHTNVIADIEAVVGEVMDLLNGDSQHVNALNASVD